MQSLGIEYQESICAGISASAASNRPNICSGDWWKSPCSARKIRFWVNMPSVEKRPPTPAVAPETAEPLPKFEEFAEKMKPYLTLVQRSDVDALLESLYQAAKGKMKLERWRAGTKDGMESLRQARKSMSQTKKLLKQAWEALTRAKERHREAIFAIQGSAIDLDKAGPTFADILQYLERAVACADYYQLVYAGLMHPDLRRKAEKRQAEQKLHGKIVAGTLVSHDYPARPKSHDIDHWFIGAGASVLDGYKTGQGKKIPNYTRIISALFRIAFHESGRSEASIQRELQRQRKHGKPIYSPTVIYWEPPRGDSEQKST